MPAANSSRPERCPWRQLRLTRARRTASLVAMLVKPRAVNRPTASRIALRVFAARRSADDRTVTCIVWRSASSPTRLIRLTVSHLSDSCLGRWPTVSLSSRRRRTNLHPVSRPGRPAPANRPPARRSATVSTSRRQAGALGVETVNSGEDQCSGQYRAERAGRSGGGASRIGSRARRTWGEPGRKWGASDVERAGSAAGGGVEDPGPQQGEPDDGGEQAGGDQDDELDGVMGGRRDRRQQRQ